MEFDLEVYLSKLKVLTPDEQVFYLIQYSCPCLLHLENICGINILEKLFSEAVSSCEDYSLFGNIDNINNQLKELVLFVKNIVNK